MGLGAWFPLHPLSWQQGNGAFVLRFWQTTLNQSVEGNENFLSVSQLAEVQTHVLLLSLLSGNRFWWK